MGYASFWPTSYLPCVGLIPSVEFTSLRLPSLSEFVLSKSFRSKWPCSIIAWNCAWCAKVQVNTDVWWIPVKNIFHEHYVNNFITNEKWNGLNWWVEKTEETELHKFPINVLQGKIYSLLWMEKRKKK